MRYVVRGQIRNGGFWVPHPKQPALLPHVADDGVLQEQARLVFSPLQPRSQIDLVAESRLIGVSAYVCCPSVLQEGIERADSMECCRSSVDAAGATGTKLCHIADMSLETSTLILLLRKR